MPKNAFFDKFISKIDSMDPRSIQSYITLLSRERGFLETVFNSIHEGIIVVDSKLKIRYHNAAAKEVLGLPDELSTLKISSVIKGIDWESMRDSQNGTSKALRQELEILYPTRRIVQLYAVPHNPDSDHFTIIVNDITETFDRINNEAQSERTQLISVLAAGVAHEIGNPLNSLYLHLQLFQRMLNKESLEITEARELVAEAKKEVERLDSIIHQFLHALRPSKPAFELISMKELILDSLRFMHHEIENRAVKVSFFSSDAMPKVNADPAQLKQAFYNLMNNSIQSMPQGGTININCNADEDSLKLEIADSGCGIQPENITKIFKPHFTTKSTGNGLGLMIVERILREHGAKLSVDSTPGKGTVFTITFPLPGRRIRVLQAPPPEASLGMLPEPAADGSDTTENRQEQRNDE